MAVTKLGYMLGHPLYPVVPLKVTIHPVRTISRKPNSGILRDCTPSVEQSAMIQSDPNGDIGSQAEMT